MFKTTGSFFAAATLTLLAATSQAQEQPHEVDRAATAVQANGAMVMAWVYPTVTYDSITGCSWSRTPEGFTLSCRFNYVDIDGDADYRDLSFRLNKWGLITAISDAGGGSIVPPFFWLRFAKGLVAEMAQEDLAQNSQHYSAEKEALLKYLADSPQPEDVLSVLLDFQIISMD